MDRGAAGMCASLVPSQLVLYLYCHTAPFSLALCSLAPRSFFLQQQTKATSQLSHTLHGSGPSLCSVHTGGLLHAHFQADRAKQVNTSTVQGVPGSCCCPRPLKKQVIHPRQHAHEGPLRAVSIPRAAAPPCDAGLAAGGSGLLLRRAQEAAQQQQQQWT